MRHLLFFLVLLVGCNTHQHTQLPKGPNGRNLDFGLTGAPYLRSLAGSMVLGEKVTIGGVGIAGTMTQAYEDYLKLLSAAPDSFWVNLSYSKNPVARMYAINALLQKKSPALSAVADRLKNDSAMVEVESGCITTYDHIDETAAIITGDTARARLLLYRRGIHH